VVAEGTRSRVVFFPRGCWKPPGRFRAHHGPASARVPAPLGRLPYYVRCGTKPF
jgi:alpha-glucosidase (family GH31 glycosyl hydrolase)